MSSLPSRRSSRFVRWVRSVSKSSSVRTGPLRVCRGSVWVGSFVVGSGVRLGWGVVRVGEVSGFGVVGLGVARLGILVEVLSVWVSGVVVGVMRPGWAMVVRFGVGVVGDEGLGDTGLGVARLWIVVEVLSGLGDRGLGVARLWTVVEVPEVEIRVSGVGVVRSGWVGVRLGWGVVVVLVAVLFVL